MNTPGNCLGCGACCFSPSEKFVRVWGDDWERLGADAGRFSHFIGHRAYMRMAASHCAALEIRTSANAATEFFCSVYERRPQICRDLARGSPECEGERHVRHSALTIPWTSLESVPREPRASDV
ncbi:MAG: YkgJ family cysteine cluster protein [Opitutaceae bacterium]